MHLFTLSKALHSCSPLKLPQIHFWDIEGLSCSEQVGDGSFAFQPLCPSGPVGLPGGHCACLRIFSGWKQQCAEKTKNDNQRSRKSAPTCEIIMTERGLNFFLLRHYRILLKGSIARLRTSLIVECTRPPRPPNMQCAVSKGPRDTWHFFTL